MRGAGGLWPKRFAAVQAVEKSTSNSTAAVLAFAAVQAVEK